MHIAKKWENKLEKFPLKSFDEYVEEVEETLQYIWELQESIHLEYPFTLK